MARTTERSHRTKGRGTNRRPVWLWAAAFAVALVAAAVALYVSMRGSESRQQTSGAPASDPGVVHIHGLGINPANGDVYAATHMGVFHINGEGEAERIADRYQDTMGFTVVGHDHFLASGHPDLREELPPLLGLLESRNAGRTWEKKSLLGKADFHALRYAHNTIYGYDSTGAAFMVSKDGRRWETRSKVTLGDFAVSPKDPDEIVATTPNGLERSTDGGRTWKRIDGPAQPVYTAWDSNDRVWVLDLEGRVHRSVDRGRTWEARGRPLGRPEALLATENEIYAAAGGAIFVSKDSGETWDVFYSEEGHHR